MTEDTMAGKWAVYSCSDYKPYKADIREISHVTATLVKLSGTCYPRQVTRNKVFTIANTKEDAESFRDHLAGISGVFENRRQSAEKDCRARVDAARIAADQKIAKLLARDSDESPDGRDAHAARSRSDDSAGRDGIAQPDFGDPS